MPPQLQLLLALAALAAPPVPLGAGALPLEVALEVRADGRALALPLAWTPSAEGALVGRAAAPQLDATVALAPAPGGARAVEVTLRWRRAAGLERAALRLGWPGAPEGLGRDLTYGPLRAPLRTGRGTPLLARAGAALLVGGPGLVAAELAPVRGGRAITATLLLDDADERPFSTYDACLPHLPPVAPDDREGWAALERRHAWRLAPRAAGAEDHLRATLYPAGGPGGLGPAVLERWPAGARAAVVFTDHADRTEAAALRAALWGRSDAAPGPTGAGLVGRGLAVTRSFFVRRGPGTLEDPATRAVAEALRAAGSEVALHSISAGRDDRAAVRAGLAEAAPLHPETWIDHEPYVNCEALSAQGAVAGGPFADADLLAAAGIRWAWAAGDVGGFGRTEVVDLLAAAPPGQASPAVFPLPGEPRLWVFRSSFFHAPPDRLAAALSDAALDRLERGQGLFVAHSYLGAGPGATRSAGQRARLVVRPLPAPGGVLALDPALDQAFGRVAARAAAGRIASLTAAAAGDRLRALGEVELAYLPDGGLALVNHAPRPLAGLTLAVPAGADYAVDGLPPAGRRDDGATTHLWLDLPAGARRVLRATRGGAPAPFLAPGGG